MASLICCCVYPSMPQINVVQKIETKNLRKRFQCMAIKVKHANRKRISRNEIDMGKRTLIFFKIG